MEERLREALVAVNNLLFATLEKVDNILDDVSLAAVVVVVCL